MPDDPKTDTISLVEEQVSVTKQAVLTGRVRIATQTETIEQRLPAELSSEEIEVVRVPVDRRVDAMPQMTTEGDLTIIPMVIRTSCCTCWRRSMRCSRARRCWACSRAGCNRIEAPNTAAPGTLSALKSLRMPSGSCRRQTR